MEVANGPQKQRTITIDDAALQNEVVVSAVKDLTLYWQTSKLPSDPPIDWGTLHCSPEGAANMQNKVIGLNEQVTLHDTRRKITTNARSCICLCYGGRILNGTFRLDEKIAVKENVNKNKVGERGYRAPGWISAPTDDKGEVAIETHSLIEELFKHLSLELTGLVVFAGATNSAKSSVAKAFCLEVIRRRIKSLAAMKESTDTQRLPHLVTFEDPIESCNIARINNKTKRISLDKTAGSEIPSLNFQFCFTPREKGKDVSTLHEALLDARRQTPSCFYVGEVRSQDDWREILDFAGTGHLVVVTTHAENIEETVSRILHATNARTPAARREVAGNLRACFHLVKKLVTMRTEDGKQSKVKGVVLPSIWLGQGQALNSLVSDGMSSLTPNGEDNISRSQFIDKIKANRFCGDPASAAGWRSAVLSEARRIDLEELKRR